MFDLISRSRLLEQYGLKDCVKYGNETAKQQRKSYNTLMMYEVADMIEDAPAAYDLDKVLKLLYDECRCCISRHRNCDFENIGNQIYAYRRAIEIVKSGIIYSRMDGD